jgi:hypothetical protein
MRQPCFRPGRPRTVPFRRQFLRAGGNRAFAGYVGGFLVVAEAEEPGVPELARRRPLGEANLADQRRLDPVHPQPGQVVPGPVSNGDRLISNPASVACRLSSTFWLNPVPTFRFGGLGLSKGKSCLRRRPLRWWRRSG